LRDFWTRSGPAIDAGKEWPAISLSNVSSSLPFGTDQNGSGMRPEGDHRPSDANNCGGRGSSGGKNLPNSSVGVIRVDVEVGVPQ